jgi:hypothetical protein
MDTGFDPQQEEWVLQPQPDAFFWAISPYRLLTACLISSEFFVSIYFNPFIFL